MSYLAYCGILCDECPIFIATKNNDLEAKEKLAQECSNDDYQFTIDDMTCEGCFSVKNDTSKMCCDCDIRNCARVKELHNCGMCYSYPCDITERRVPDDSASRITLDDISKTRSCKN